MPRVARVLWPAVMMAAVAIVLELYLRRRVLDREAADEDDAPVDDTLDQSFPASDPPSWSSAAAAPSRRSTRGARATRSS